MDAKPLIEFEDFAKIDLRIGCIDKAELHPNADKLLVLTVDFGSLGKRTICAGIRKFYDPSESLVGTKCVFCINLKPRMMRGIESQGMILAASNEDHSRVQILANGQNLEVGDIVG